GQTVRLLPIGQPVDPGLGRRQERGRRSDRGVASPGQSSRVRPRAGRAFVERLGAILAKDLDGSLKIFVEHHQPDADQPTAAKEAIGFGVENDGIDAFRFQSQAIEISLNPSAVSRQRDQAHAAVPPTVMPSISRLGWPTPAGTDWPPLPHMPTPSSNDMSLPMPLTRVSTVGPSPISVAPLIGGPSFPLSMR